MLTCREVARAIASDEVAEAAWRQRLAVRFHLLLCRHCRRYAFQLREIGRATRELVTSEPPDVATLERLERSICQKLDADADSPSSSEPASH
jgi:hypothetical protein